MLRQVKAKRNAEIIKTRRKREKEKMRDEGSRRK